MCHDEDGWCQIPIHSFLLEVKAEVVLAKQLVLRTASTYQLLVKAPS